MEKFIPYDKLSKKKRRELDAQRRGSWGALNPVSRRTPNPKAYDRNKARRWDPNDPASVLLFCRFIFLSGADACPRAAERRFLCSRAAA